MVKVTPSAIQDTTLLVVEVKVDESKNVASWDSCGHQIGSYTIALSRQSGDLRLAGLSICGHKARIFRLEGSSFTRDGVMRSINSKTVSQLLLSIATENWSYSG